MSEEDARAADTAGLHVTAARGFEAGADAYERARPDYPDEAVDFLVEHLPAGRWLDLGAGTGKLTIMLDARGIDVVAVEPVEGMRARLAAMLPGVEALDGSAESIPLPDASVDAITVAQAFHWFRHDEALAEMHRVLRPGGRFALVWNVRDESVPWVAEITEIIRPYEGDGAVRIPRHKEGAWRTPLAASPLFRSVAETSIPYEHETDADGLVDRVASVSFVAVQPEDVQADIFAAVHALTERPPLRGRETFTFPYLTDIDVYERVG